MGKTTVTVRTSPPSPEPQKTDPQEAGGGLLSQSQMMKIGKQDAFPAAALAQLRKRTDDCAVAHACYDLSILFASQAAIAATNYDSKQLEKTGYQCRDQLFKAEKILRGGGDLVDDWREAATGSESGGAALRSLDSAVKTVQGIAAVTGKSLARMLTLPTKRVPCVAWEGELSEDAASAVMTMLGDCAVANALLKDAAKHADTTQPDAVEKAAQTLVLNYFGGADDGQTYYYARRLAKSAASNEVVTRVGAKIGVNMNGLGRELDAALTQNPALLEKVESWDEPGMSGAEKLESTTGAMREVHRQANAFVAQHDAINIDKIVVPTLPVVGSEALPRGFSRLVRMRSLFLAAQRTEHGDYEPAYEEWKQGRADLLAGMASYQELAGHDATLAGKVSVDIERIDNKLATKSAIAARNRLEAGDDSQGVDSVAERIAVRDIVKAATKADEARREMLGSFADGIEAAINVSYEGTAAEAAAGIDELYAIPDEHIRAPLAAIAKTVSALMEIQSLEEALDVLGKPEASAEEQDGAAIDVAKVARTVLDAVASMLDALLKGGIKAAEKLAKRLPAAAAARFEAWAASASKLSAQLDKAGKALSVIGIGLGILELGHALATGDSEKAAEAAADLAGGVAELGLEAAGVGAMETSAIGMVISLEVQAVYEIVTKLPGIAKAAYNIDLSNACGALAKSGQEVIGEGNRASASAAVVDHMEFAGEFPKDDLDHKKFSQAAEWFQDHGVKCATAMNGTAKDIPRADMREAFSEKFDAEGGSGLTNQLRVAGNGRKWFWAAADHLRQRVKAFRLGLAAAFDVAAEIIAPPPEEREPEPEPQPEPEPESESYNEDLNVEEGEDI